MTSLRSASAILSQLRVYVLLYTGTAVDYLDQPNGLEVLLGTAVAVNNAQTDELLARLAAFLDEMPDPDLTESIISPALVRSMGVSLVA